MRLIKLDARYKGHGLFTHRLEFSNGKQGIANSSWPAVKRYLTIQRWCAEKFGPSADLCTWWIPPSHEWPTKLHNELWSWDIDSLTIYLRGKAATSVALKLEFWTKDENL